MNRVIFGDCRDVMRDLIKQGVKVQMCVTSPPYWGLRDYGVPPSIWNGDSGCEHEWGADVVDRSRATPGTAGSGLTNNGEFQAASMRFEKRSAFCKHCNAWRGALGLEPTPDLFVQHIVEIFRLVRELLADDGTCWINLGDSYAGSGQGFGDVKTTNKANGTSRGVRIGSTHGESGHTSGKRPPAGLKAKDLVGIPWRVAFALQADGWYLRSEITWCKRAPMPESVTDRPTSATEKIFLLSKRKKYYYDAEAVRERSVEPNWESRLARISKKSMPTDKVNGIRTDKQRGHSRRHAGFNDRWDAMEKAEPQAGDRNMRNWWLLGPEPFAGAHFAVFPSEIPERCILAGSRPGDIVLDPFGGSGTTAAVAEKLGRKWLLIELNEEYGDLIKDRTCQMAISL